MKRTLLLMFGLTGCQEAVAGDFSLRGSIGEETSSIYSYQLDEDFDTYAAGVTLPDGREALNVRPWDQSIHSVEPIE